MEKVTCYKTTDGKVFENELKAIAYEKKLKYDKNKYKILQPIIVEFKNDEYDQDYSHFSFDDIEDILHHNVDINAIIKIVEDLI